MRSDEHPPARDKAPIKDHSGPNAQAPLNASGKSNTWPQGKQNPLSTAPAMINAPVLKDPRNNPQVKPQVNILAHGNSFYQNSSDQERQIEYLPQGYTNQPQSIGQTHLVGQPHPVGQSYLVGQPQFMVQPQVMGQLQSVDQSQLPGPNTVIGYPTSNAHEGQIYRGEPVCQYNPNKLLNRELQISNIQDDISGINGCYDLKMCQDRSYTECQRLKRNTNSFNKQLMDLMWNELLDRRCGWQARKAEGYHDVTTKIREEVDTFMGQLLLKYDEQLKQECFGFQRPLGKMEMKQEKQAAIQRRKELMKRQEARL